MRIWCVSHLALFVGLAIAAPDPIPQPSPVVLPTPPVVPVPMPPSPPPGAVMVLGPNQLYVAQSKVEFVVRDHPKKLIKTTYEKGPIVIRAKFVDGPDTAITRTYDAAYVALVESAGNGRVELDFIPYGFKAESEIATARLDASISNDPVPVPPKPVPPDPVPVPPVPTEGKRWLLVIEETSDANWQARRGILVTDVPLHDRIKEKGHDWKLVDKDIKDTSGKTPLDLKPYIDRSAGKPLPWVFIVDGNGKVWSDEAYPGTPAKLLEKLKGVGG